MTTFLRPGDDGFDAEVAAFNLAQPVEPEVVVAARDEADVVAAVGFAREHGLPVRVLSTGHGLHAPITDGVLVNVRHLDRVEVDAGTRLARIGGGARWAAVIDAAADHGLAPITGSSPSVGVVGFLAGGGLGPLARSHGFGSDRVRALRVALADGRVVNASSHENPELFWALRGGKGGLGVITETTLELVPLTELYAGALVFATEHIETVLRGWTAWTAQAPDGVTTSVAVIDFPPLEEVPEPMRGRRLLMLRYAFPGDVVTGETLAAPLRALAPIHLDLLGPLDPRQVGLIHSDPADPTASWTSGEAIARVPDGFVDALLPFLSEGTTAPFVAVELRHVGSEVTRRDVAGGSAVGGRDVDYFLFVIGVPDSSLFETVMPAARDAVVAAVAPWIAPGMTANWAGPTTVHRVWDAVAEARLAAVREAYDPDDLFPFALT